jgi:hypothetical protein
LGCSTAAANNQADITAESLETLLWLHENGCPWNVADVRTAAVKSGKISILAYVIQHGGMPDAAELTDMLNVAGAHGEVEAAKWLRQQGAQWPTVLQYTEPPVQGMPLQFSGWGLVLDWARSEGCTSEAPPGM